MFPNPLQPALHAILSKMENVPSGSDTYTFTRGYAPDGGTLGCPYIEVPSVYATAQCGNGRQVIAALQDGEIITWGLTLTQKERLGPEAAASLEVLLGYLREHEGYHRAFIDQYFLTLATVFSRFGLLDGRSFTVLSGADPTSSAMSSARAELSVLNGLLLAILADANSRLDNMLWRPVNEEKYCAACKGFLPAGDTRCDGYAPPSSP